MIVANLIPYSFAWILIDYICDNNDDVHIVTCQGSYFLDIAIYTPYPEMKLQQVGESILIWILPRGKGCLFT